MPADSLVLCRINVPILDGKGRIFCVKLSRDSDAPQRTADLDKEYTALQEFIGKQQPHRRGDFSTCKFGFSYGMGQTVCACSLHRDQIVTYQPTHRP